MPAGDRNSARGTAPLPPGQCEGPWRPFGLPSSANWQTTVDHGPTIRVRRGAGIELTCDVGRLIETMGRRHQVSDLHCVATWSARDLGWSGLSFHDFSAWLSDSIDTRGTRWLRCTGRDGFTSCLYLADALAPDVLIADRVAGQPLTLDQGAPLRLVAPSHYGYKGVKYLQRITLLDRYRSGSAGWAEHPRGRVVAEERSSGLPGVIYRYVYRALKPRAFAVYDRRRRHAMRVAGANRAPDIRRMG